MRRELRRVRRLDVWQKVLVAAWLWACLQVGVVLLATRGVARDFAIAQMAAGLFALWVMVGGAVQWQLRDSLARLLQRLPMRWQAQFVIGCVALALTEEAIATLMTNLAPLFGSNSQEAFITASPNYFEVVLGHSVIVFAPMFAAWAWLLSRYAFAPAQAMVLFGITGVLAETLSFGMQMLLGWGFWVWVYGLMVWLPAYAVQSQVRQARPRWFHNLLALFAPVACAVPVVVLVN
ncbi:MAG: hypothetical protein NZM28_06730 [Fimbriimonadales bacterium]|nr:hypothetical protein [Fimbriimonadales bacterium]